MAHLAVLLRGDEGKFRSDFSLVPNLSILANVGPEKFSEFLTPSRYAKREAEKI